MTNPRTPSPLAAVRRGLLAGLAGTAAMTAYQTAVQKLQGGGSSSEPPESWDEAPAPAQVGERVVEGVFREPVSIERSPLMTQVVHWLYGTAWGGVYGVAAPSVAAPFPIKGAGFGSAVWGSSYVTLPAMGIYKPIWKYPAGTLASEWAMHAVYGLGVAGAFAALQRRAG